MSENERRKGQHLCWMDRHEIQKGLRRHRSFVEIARIIGCAPETASKEIRNHRYCKKHDSSKFYLIGVNSAILIVEGMYVIRRKDTNAEFHVGNAEVVINFAQTLLIIHAR